MTGLKEIALITAIVAAPFTGSSRHDDSIMGGITRQSGVTIEMETRVDISDVSMDLVINDVVIGGSNDDVASRSIGSIALDNLAISQTRLAVYGH